LVEVGKNEWLFQEMSGEYIAQGLCCQRDTGGKYEKTNYSDTFLFIDICILYQKKI